MVKLVVAYDGERGIGRAGTIPWFLPGEQARMAAITKETAEPGKLNALIMGRRTYFSLPPARRPLPGRRTIVVSTRDEYPDDVWVAQSLREAIAMAEASQEIEDVIVFGGAMLYEQALLDGVVDELLVTVVSGTHGCDTFFPEIPGVYMVCSSTSARYGDEWAEHQVYRRGA